MNNSNYMALSRSVGRPAVGYSAEDYIKQYRLLHNWSRVADFFGVSRQTVYKTVKLSGYKKDYSI